MQDRPTMRELLDVVQRFLDEEIVPATQGRRQFLARVAANTLRLIDRELESEETHQDGEWSRLEAILGQEPRPATREATRAAIVRRNSELCELIRGGAVDQPGPGRERLMAHVRQTVRDKLLVTNLGYLRADGEL